LLYLNEFRCAATTLSSVDDDVIISGQTQREIAETALMSRRFNQWRRWRHGSIVPGFIHSSHGHWGGCPL